jgi:hypothetical protein
MEPRVESAAAPERLDRQPVEAEVAALREQLRQSEQALARLPELEYEATLAAQDRQELDEARQRIEVLEADLARAHEGLEHTSRVIDDMTSSISWRVTRPLRALRRP